MRLSDAATMAEESIHSGGLTSWSRKIAFFFNITTITRDFLLNNRLADELGNLL